MKSSNNTHQAKESNSRRNSGKDYEDLVERLYMELPGSDPATDNPDQQKGK